MKYPKIGNQHSKLLARVDHLSTELEALGQRSRIYAIATLAALVMVLLTSPAGMAFCHFLIARFSLDSFFNDCLVALAVAIASCALRRRTQAKRRSRR